MNTREAYEREIEQHNRYGWRRGSSGWSTDYQEDVNRMLVNQLYYQEQIVKRLEEKIKELEEKTRCLEKELDRVKNKDNESTYSGAYTKKKY